VFTLFREIDKCCEVDRIEQDRKEWNSFRTFPEPTLEFASLLPI